jgi:hypothetical protein
MKFIILAFLILYASCTNHRAKQLFDKLNEEQNPIPMQRSNHDNIQRNSNENASSLFDTLENNNTNINMIEKNDTLPSVPQPQVKVKETVSLGGDDNPQSELNTNIEDKKETNLEDNSNKKNTSVSKDDKADISSNDENNKKEDSNIGDYNTEKKEPITDNNEIKDKSKESTKLKQSSHSGEESKSKKVHKKNNKIQTESIKNESRKSFNSKSDKHEEAKIVQTLKSEVESLKKSNGKKDEHISFIQKELNSLKNQNSALRGKLSKKLRTNTKKQENKIFSFIQNLDKKVDVVKTNLTDETQRLGNKLLNKEAVISSQLNKGNKSLDAIEKKLATLENQLKATKILLNTSNEGKLKVDSLFVKNSIIIKDKAETNSLQANEAQIGNIKLSLNKLSMPGNTTIQIGTNGFFTAEDLLNLSNEAKILTERCGEKLSECVFLKDERENTNDLLKNLELLKKKLKTRKYSRK